jgi:hypothetical protein
MKLSNIIKHLPSMEVKIEENVYYKKVNCIGDINQYVYAQLVGKEYRPF